ncbi:MAG: hypothetical protein ACSHYA_01865 [Opitutaceae bacterium]
MKTLFRICLVGIVFVVVALVVAYFVVTSAGFQKRMLEGKLPAGSSVKHVHVTTGSLKLSQLILALPDGTRVKVEEVDTSFSPMAAIFDNTIQMGALNVNGLMIQLPEAIEVPEVGSSETPVSSPVEQSGSSSAQTGAPSNPWDLVNAIGELEWLVDIERIQLSGKLKDATGTTYDVDVKSGAIRPSAETVVNALLTLVSSEPTQSGLKEFNSELELGFKQKALGGFEKFSLKSSTAGSDFAGNEIVAVSNQLDLIFDGFEETASLVLSFDADLQKPEVFLPELESMGALQIKGSLDAKVDGVVVSLSDASLALVAQGSEVLALDLKKALNLGGKQNLSGELLSLQVKQLPLAWSSPWLPVGMSIQGESLNASISVTGLDDGAMEMTTASPLRLGPITVQNEGAVYLQEASIVVDPVIRVNADQSIEYEIRTFQLLDRYGEVISGQVSGRSELIEGSTNPFHGHQADVNLNVRLQELFQLPLLKDTASILGGELALVAKIDGANAFPLTVQGDLKGLRPRSAPGSIKDYRFLSQLQSVSADVWGVGFDFESGNVERPSTSLQVAGQANAASSPLSFMVSLTGSKLSQTDMDVLAAAFSPNESTAVTPSRANSPTKTVSSQQPAVSDAAMPPPWAGVDGEASVKLDQVVLTSGQIITNVGAKITVSEALLKINELSASAGEGTLQGMTEVHYDASQMDAYALNVDLGFRQFDPAFFSQKRSGSFPITGLFDGGLKLNGEGSSLELAADNSVADLTITGKDGLLTAFELGRFRQTGLLAAGLFGQSVSPEFSAVANTIPYFKDIRFDNFVFNLKRGKDRKVMIPKLLFEGQSLLIDGSGVIAASSFKDLMDQPLELNLALGARGQLVDYLETLNLLKSVPAEDGFRRWTDSFSIDGTLSKPNTDQITDLLWSTAQKAVSGFLKKRAPVVPETTSETPSQTDLQEPSEPVKKSKEEKLRDDIDVGLDILNSFLGG